MTSYKLLYFDYTRGRAEATRMLFAVAIKELEEVRITKEEWPKIKPSKSQLQIIMCHSVYNIKQIQKLC